VDIVFIEPFDGGSHRAFREGLAARSRHTIRSFVLPPRFWKWRMRGAAAWFADLINAERPPCDLLLVTDFLNVADLRGLLDPPYDRLPLLLYMHENQLTYPLSPEEAFDFHFGATNIVSALAADAVVFNSGYHRDLFLDALPDYLARMPDAIPRNVRQRLEWKSAVLPVGIGRSPHAAGTFAPWLGGACAPEAGPPWPRDGGKGPLLLWNHRWEFDKRPEWLARALARLDGEGIPFRVALLGDDQGHPEPFAPLRERLGERCVAFGHAGDRAEYESWLARADAVVSCAAQEYFGIAVAEAVHAGAYAVLPREQVYPTLYGRRCRGRHLYAGEEGLTDLLRNLLRGRACGHVCSLPLDCDEFCWDRLAARYDALLESVAGKEVRRAETA
jgi:glycosyltransferase involved in cell wall biosynthesis